MRPSSLLLHDLHDRFGNRLHDGAERRVALVGKVEGVVGAEAIEGPKLVLLPSRAATVGRANTSADAELDSVADNFAQEDERAQIDESRGARDARVNRDAQGRPAEETALRVGAGKVDGWTWSGRAHAVSKLHLEPKRCPRRDEHRTAKRYRFRSGKVVSGQECSASESGGVVATVKKQSGCLFDSSSLCHVLRAARPPASAPVTTESPHLLYCSSSSRPERSSMHSSRPARRLTMTPPNEPVRTPATQVDSAEAAVAADRTGLTGCGSSSSKSAQGTGQRSGEESSQSRAQSIAAAGAIESKEGERESAEGQHMSVGGIGAASGSGQRQPREGSEGDEATAGETTAEQVDQR